MKKVSISFMCSIMFLIFTFFLVSCGKKECEHNWGNEVVKTEATCTSEGETEYTCSKCKATKTVNTEKTEHKKSKDFKYDSLGHFSYCTVCGENYEKTKHTMVDFEVQQEPTAYEAGVMTTKCNSCDYKSTREIEAVSHEKGLEYKSNDEYHWYECTAHENCPVEIQKQKHTLVEGEVIKEPAAEEDGKKKVSCSVCNYVGEVTIPALNHRKGELDFDDNEHWYTCDRHKDCDAKIEISSHTWELISDTATCTANGTAVFKCSVCSKTKEEASLAKHSYGDWKIIKEATETSTGIRERECSVCGHKETGTIPVIGHVHNYDTNWTIDKEATCTEPGSKSHHCLGCDDKVDVTIIPATGHNYGQWVEKQEKTCTTDGKEGHFKCSVCNTYFNIDKEEVEEDSLIIPTTGHDYSVWKETQHATLYADGIETIYCSHCDAEGTDTRKIQAQADFRSDFSLETADGTWKYGSIDYNWGAETFNFAPATEKNGANDGWVTPGVEIKNDWINSEGMVGIAYTVTENVHVIVNLKFIGGTEKTRLDLRVGIKNSEGTLYGNPSFHNNPDSNELERLLQFDLNAGDTIYFIFSNGAGEVEGAYPNGNLSINLKKPSADFRTDFNLETADGTWKYGSIDYNWGAETFNFAPATEKNGANDGWVTPGVEIKNDWINSEGMVGIAYTVTENVHVIVNLKFIGGTEKTRLDLRVGIKNSEGTLYGNPSFHNNPDSNELERLLQFDLNSGDTIYFIFSNGAGGAEGAYPNGNLDITIF